MLTPVELRTIAQERLQDAHVLCANGRYDGAGYICGYAVELALKARICETLNWLGFPQTAKEFTNYASFKTHSFVVLLSLSGREQVIKQSHLADWSFVCQWNPEDRYRIVGGISANHAQQFLTSTTALLQVI
jgi:hypothetical protein